jgi:hypothetical protein
VIGFEAMLRFSSYIEAGDDWGAVGFDLVMESAQFYRERPARIADVYCSS